VGGGGWGLFGWGVGGLARSPFRCQHKPIHPTQAPERPPHQASPFPTNPPNPSRASEAAAERVCSLAAERDDLQARPLGVGAWALARGVTNRSPAGPRQTKPHPSKRVKPAPTATPAPTEPQTLEPKRNQTPTTTPPPKKGLLLATLDRLDAVEAAAARSLAAVASFSCSILARMSRSTAASRSTRRLIMSSYHASSSACFLLQYSASASICCIRRLANGHVVIFLLLILLVLAISLIAFFAMRQSGVLCSCPPTLPKLVCTAGSVSMSKTDPVGGMETDSTPRQKDITTP
jgi:hypothetical protein